MSTVNRLGFGTPRLSIKGGPDVERVVQQRPLQRVLAFLGHSIDDVVNDPIVRTKVFGYYKLQRQVDRAMEVSELERWWNRSL
jgi:hypothetical protein